VNNNAGKKTAELVAPSAPTLTASQQPKQPTYDLNVEVHSDGSIKIIPPLTNSLATNSAAAP
jgi:hypothetical protein